MPKIMLKIQKLENKYYKRQYKNAKQDVQYSVIEQAINSELKDLNSYTALINAL